MIDLFKGVTDYWRGHVLTSLAGAAVLYGALRAFGALLQVLGVV